MRKYLAIFLVLAILLVGCAKDDEKGKSKSSKDEDVTIGMCFDTFTIERWLKDRDVFTYTATELGEKVEVQNANGDVEKQREQIEHFIDIKVKAIVVIAVDADEITDLINEAADKGIKIIAYDRLIENAHVDLYISFDNYMVGQLMAERLDEKLIEAGNATKNILMICGPNSDKNVAMVKSGFLASAKEANFTIVDTTNIEGWRAENVDSFFSLHPNVLDEVDGIMCGNDSLAGAVIQTLSANRLAGNVLVTGQDADLDACQRIVEGTQTVTIYKPVEQMAKIAAEDTVKLIHEEESFLEDVEYLDNGDGMIPYVGLLPISVTAENMDEIIIESGFHLKEDVYRNAVFLTPKNE